MYQAIIVGGGLAGLLNSILLAKAGVSVLVIEKKAYPFHKVCGEFVSNEVRSFLQSEGLYPEQLSPPQINRLVISSVKGKSQDLALPMGGFGVSRYHLEHFWYQKALELGVEVKQNTAVARVVFDFGKHLITTGDGNSYEAQIVIGAYGKRSQIDKGLNRSFIHQRSAYLGVKYHLEYQWDPQVIALHAFDHGYCGISMVEQGKLNFCYLSSRNNLRNQGDIDALENNVLSKNPHLAKVLREARRLFEKPLVINEISFAPKKTVVDHVLMSGDAAGMITPLCGNGMAMAIHSAVLLAPKVRRFFEQESYTREDLESDYHLEWQHNFSGRLATGRFLQKAFFNKGISSLLIEAARFPLVAQWIVRQTHGKQF